MLFTRELLPRWGKSKQAEKDVIKGKLSGFVNIKVDFKPRSITSDKDRHSQRPGFQPSRRRDRAGCARTQQQSKNCEAKPDRTTGGH